MNQWIRIIVLGGFISAVMLAPQAYAKDMGKEAVLKRIQRAQLKVAAHDARTTQDIYEDMKQSSSTEASLQIYEAIAATYSDLVRQIDAHSPEDKRKLYDQIRMNVAFIQFGGNPGARDGNKINTWIRQTLIKHLSEELRGDKSMFYSADEWGK